MIDLQHPEVQRLLRRIKKEHATDPFAVARVVCYLQNGILELSDFNPKKSLPAI